MKRVSYRNYLLVVLLLIQAHNYVDRQALGLVLQDIKIDLHLTDTQLGLLTGIAFALFYSVMGIPIARWADRGNRVAILSLSVALWALLVAVCGRATNFWQLMLLRAGIGVGEAGSFPSAQSLIPDYFTRAERPRANSIYMLNGPLSTVGGLFVAGWLSELCGWRTMFVLLGLPGVALALLAWTTLKEPRLTGSRAATRDSTSRPSSGTAARAPMQHNFKEVVTSLWAIRSFRPLLCSLVVQYFLSYGIAQFQPAFLVRSFGFKTGELGTWYAVVFGLGSLLGIYAGGQMASRYAANDERLQLRVAALTYGVYAAVSMFVYLSANRYLVFALLGLGTLVINLFTGPLYATLQTLVPPRMRALATAGIFFFTNLIGTGLGPLAVGALSDALRPWFGEESLRYALLTASPCYLLGAAYLWRGSQAITGDLQAAQGHLVTNACPEPMPPQSIEV